jgi:hypothetical protein
VSRKRFYGPKLHPNENHYPKDSIIEVIYVHIYLSLEGLDRNIQIITSFPSSLFLLLIIDPQFILELWQLTSFLLK